MTSYRDKVRAALVLSELDEKRWGETFDRIEKELQEQGKTLDDECPGDIDILVKGLVPDKMAEIAVAMFYMFGFCDGMVGMAHRCELTEQEILEIAKEIYMSPQFKPPTDLHHIFEWVDRMNDSLDPDALRQALEYDDRESYQRIMIGALAVAVKRHLEGFDDI